MNASTLTLLLEGAGVSLGPRPDLDRAGDDPRRRAHRARLLALAALRVLYPALRLLVRGTPLLVLALLISTPCGARPPDGPTSPGAGAHALRGRPVREVSAVVSSRFPRPPVESAKSLGLPPAANVKKVIGAARGRYTLPPTSMSRS